MGLSQIDTLDPESAQGILRVADYRRAREIFGPTGVRAATQLGGEEKLVALATLLQELPDQLLAPAATVNVCGVKEIDASVRSRGQGRKRLFITDFTPLRAAQLPRSQPNFGNGLSDSGKNSRLHQSLLKWEGFLVARLPGRNQAAAQG